MCSSCRVFASSYCISHLNCRHFFKMIYLLQVNLLHVCYAESFRDQKPRLDKCCAPKQVAYFQFHYWHWPRNISRIPVEIKPFRVIIWLSEICTSFLDHSLEFWFYHIMNHLHLEKCDVYINQMTGNLPPGSLIGCSWFHLMEQKALNRIQLIQIEWNSNEKREINLTSQ